MGGREGRGRGLTRRGLRPMCRVYTRGLRVGQHTPALRSVISRAAGSRENSRPAGPAPQHGSRRTRRRGHPRRSHPRPRLSHYGTTYRQVHAHILQVLTLRQVDVVRGGQDTLSAPQGASRHNPRPQYTMADSREEAEGNGTGERGEGWKSKKKKRISPTSQHPPTTTDSASHA